jgi:hypothetical protein
MSRSLKKGPFVSYSLMDKIYAMNLEKSCVSYNICNSFIFWKINTFLYYIKSTFCCLVKKEDFLFFFEALF